MIAGTIMDSFKKPITTGSKPFGGSPHENPAPMLSI